MSRDWSYPCHITLSKSEQAVTPTSLRLTRVG